MKYAVSRLLGGAFLLCAAASPLSAQSTYRGDVTALRDEVQRRAGLGRHPVIGLNPEDVRTGLVDVTSKDPDVWASAWMKIGDRYARQGDAATGPDAMRAYGLAYRWYSFARWPTPSSPQKMAAYRKSIDMFRKWNALSATPADTVRFSFGGKEAVAYLRIPASQKPVPLIVQISGLDGYKEGGAMDGALQFARQGIATLTMDAPGTGESVKVTPEAWRALDGLIRSAVARREIDAKRVVLIGGSYGGYWATLLAHADKDLFAGVVAQGAPVEKAFQRDYFTKNVLEGDEYLFDVTVAWMGAFDGITSVPQLLPALETMSLGKAGYIGKPTPPMLLLNGALDTLAPIDDLFLVARSGDVAKDVWVNPQGLHMGRQPGVWDSPKINQQVVMPWVYRRLGMTPPGDTRAATLGGQIPEDASRSPAPGPSAGR